MLDGLFMLVMLSLVMAMASFFAGALPLSMTLSQSQLRLISTIGMGVLVGTSLVVIIPEGIETIYSAGSASQAHARRGLAGIISARSNYDLDTAILPGWLQTRNPTDIDPFNLPGPVIDVAMPDVEVANPALKIEAAQVAPAQTTPSTEEPHHSDPPTFWVGLSLIVGFILMFLIDKLPRHASEQLAPPPPTRHISLNNLSQGLHEPNGTPTADEESESFLQSLAPSPKMSRSLATTTGLVIHAAADGIAMGASASTANTKLGFIIFIAIMIHKAPAAFGLTSVLLKQGLSKRAARGHLIVFSLAAPTGALGTFFIVHLLGVGGPESASGEWWTGMLLLFSAGTFLYVAMHAMQEDSISSHSHEGANGFAEIIPSGRKPARPQVRDTFAAVAGMLLPLLTQFGHGH